MLDQNDLKPMMRVILESSKLHASWLNMLSHLEYVGFSKIVKSQDVNQMSWSTMQHASEELRHAQLLKKLSMRVGGDEFGTYNQENMLCGREARNYFETIDHSCDAVLSEEADRARLCYLYVTWLVEVRALDVYGDYMQVVKEFGLSSPLESLIKEEDKHLHDVTESLASLDPQFSLRQVEMKGMEEKAYAIFVQSLKQRLSEH